MGSYRVRHYCQYRVGHYCRYEVGTKSDLATAAATAATSLNLVITRTENLAYHRKSVNMANSA